MMKIIPGFYLSVGPGCTAFILAVQFDYKPAKMRQNSPIVALRNPRNEENRFFFPSLRAHAKQSGFAPPLAFSTPAL